MKTVSVVFHSGSGHTKAMAEAVAKGVRSVKDVKMQLLEIKNAQIVEGRFKDDALLEALDQSDGIIFGSPTYMGNVSGQFKCFADASGLRWMSQKWRGKVAGGFTVSGSPSGDKLHTLSYMALLAAQHCMIWVGSDVSPRDSEGRNRLGSYLGVMGQAGQEPPDVAPNGADKATGERLGERIAEFALKL